MLIKIMVRSCSVGKESVTFVFVVVICFWDPTYRVNPWLNWPFFSNFNYTTPQTVMIHLIYFATLRPHIRGKQEQYLLCKGCLWGIPLVSKQLKIKGLELKSNTAREMQAQHFSRGYLHKTFLIQNIAIVILS